MGKREVLKLNKEITAIRAARMAGDIAKVCALKEGRRFVRDLLSFCGVYEDPMTGDSYTFHNAGRQQVGVHVMRLIYRADPELRLQIEREYQSEEISNEQKRIKALRTGVPAGLDS